MYKREEGLWARVPSAIVGGVVTIYMTNAAREWTDNAIMGYIFAGVAFLLFAAVTIYFCFFQQKVSDVLIETETEMRKVVWPSKDEVTGSTGVVIATTIILGLVIFVIDVIFAQTLRFVLYR